MSRYVGPVKWLGGIAIILFVLAAVFGSVAPGLVSEDVRNGVLFQAVPFILVFVGILLLYVLLITLVALRFNGKVPGRTYNGVERLTIIGIVFGTACLFNPWSFVPYRYGFLMLLVSTLAFILWSHISPPRTDFDTNVPPLSRAQNIAGLVAGLVVLVILMLAFISAVGPAEPYGLRERVWNSYTPERQAEVAAEATQQFNTVEMPFLVIFNLFPAAAVYLIVRELVGNGKEDEPILREMSPASSGAD